ncbi:hypothetical protein MAH1_33910 [Sessilibacter sp. MAH1]
MDKLIYVENLELFRAEIESLASTFPDFIYQDGNDNYRFKNVFCPVRYSKDGQSSIGTARLDTPEKLNAFTQLTSAEIIGELVAGADDYIFEDGGQEKLESVCPRDPVEMTDPETGEVTVFTPPKIIIRLM